MPFRIATINKQRKKTTTKYLGINLVKEKKTSTMKTLGCYRKKLKKIMEDGKISSCSWIRKK